MRRMKVEEIAEAIAKLPPDQLARFRRWFTAFEAGRGDHAKELDSTATKLGRLAGRAFAELKKRGTEIVSEKERRMMSLMGQNRKCAVQLGMTALCQ